MIRQRPSPLLSPSCRRHNPCSFAENQRPQERLRITTEDEKRRLTQLVQKTPSSRWSYWPFVFPLLVVVVVVGAVIHASLFVWLRSNDIEMWLHDGNHAEPVWESKLVRQLILSLSLCVIGAFGGLALLGELAYRQAQALRSLVLMIDFTDAGLHNCSAVQSTDDTATRMLSS